MNGKIKKTKTYMSELDSKFSAIQNLESLMEKIKQSNNRISITKKEYKQIYNYLGHYCILCGIQDPVQIHHLFSKGDNSYENLVVLCPNHHVLVHKGLISNKDLFDLKHITAKYK